MLTVTFMLQRWLSVAQDMRPTACLTLYVDLDIQNGGFDTRLSPTKEGAVMGAGPAVFHGFFHINACEHMTELCLVCETKKGLERYELCL